MKAILIILSIGLATFLGLFPAINKQKSMLWKVFTVVILTIAVILNFLPPTTANTNEADFLARKNHQSPLNIQIATSPELIKFDSNQNYWKVQTTNNNKTGFFITDSQIVKKFNRKADYIVRAIYYPEENSYKITGINAINPIFTFPYIPGLEERIRIMNFHVPMAWIAVIAFLLSMIYAIRYLKTKDIKFDLYSSSIAAIGLLFTFLATTTGMLWAKYNWGSFWNWDPREVSIFILLLIYSAYFGLRNAISNYETRARLSSVYSILAFTTVPFLIFILPRLQAGLHPGSGSDTNIGPILSSEQGLLDNYLLYTFCLSLFAFLLLFYWLTNLSIRTHNYQINKIHHASIQ